MIMVRLNGCDVQLRAHTSLTDLVNKTIAPEMGRDPRGIAIELNGVIAPKSQYSDTLLGDGDKVEIVQFVGGG